jgi:hypothetical protein
MILSSIYNIVIFVIALTMLYGLATMCTQHTLAGGGLLSGGLHVSNSYLTTPWANIMKCRPSVVRIIWGCCCRAL